MTAEDPTDNALVVRVPNAQPSPYFDPPGPRSGSPSRDGVARGVAKIIRPRTVRARAAVPGALSIPRRKPSRSLRLGQPATPFPRRVFPKPSPAPAPTPPSPAATICAPSLRPPIAPEPVRGKALDRKRRSALPVAAAVVAAVVAGAGYLALADRPPGGPGPPAAVGETTTTSTGVAERPVGDPFGSVVAAPAGPPTRLRIGAIKVDTPLETLRIGSDGALQPPKAFEKAGWYADGTAPGDTGPAVLAGHVDSRSGPAVFYRLRNLGAGDRVDVVRGGVSLQFKVTAIRWYPKAEFPTEEVYGPTPDRQLRLITCGGVFDRSLRSYRDNLVVYAVAG
ncbi:class F sortase [Actinoplanes solisilvae]|uniref:class F sortase n=1 Tax=Actinoplanes solisilvae TaxID=2486853 RepID=UPI001F0C302C|nr:class F sortase [Actinoplanes solisilvae]